MLLKGGRRAKTVNEAGAEEEEEEMVGGVLNEVDPSDNGDPLYGIIYCH